jgi:MoCo/4Fe-4S cofactor protein with predicted Tat translocation signal
MSTHYYKSLDELRRDSRELADRRRAEFAEPLPWKAGAEPAAAPATTRRDFLGLMGFALGAAACSRAPVHKAIPLLTGTEELTPGLASWYATTCGGCAAGCSLLVKTRDGRPIKVEGNPEAPLFGGGTCAVGQATVLSLYDEQRLRGPRWQGQAASWDEVDHKVQERLQAVMAARHAVVLLTGPVLGPATREIIARWSRRYPAFRHVVYEPASQSALRQAWQEAVGRPLVPHPRFDRAALIVGLEADFLGTWLSPVEFTRQYARRRQPSPAMARHVQFESGLSLTGANADERHAVAPAEVGAVALALLRSVQALAAQRPLPQAAGLPVAGQVVADLARELWRHAGESLVVCGVPDTAVQLLVAALNHALGNVGRTLEVARPSLQAQADDREMARLVDEMNEGRVQALILHGVNPVYDYPEAERFAQGLERAALTVSLAERLDETAARVHAVCPDHHFLEAWGDAEPVASCFGLAQPTLAPLFATRAAQESLLQWLGERPDFHTFLREHWRREVFPRQQAEADFERFWARTLQAGFLELETAPEPVPPFGGDVERAAGHVETAQALAQAQRTAGRLDLHLYQTVALRDGRHANNPWLQELPDPITKLTWGQAAAVAPALAARLGLEEGDVVALSQGPLRLELPVYLQPGQSPSSVSVALGYGRTHAGPVARDLGVNAYPWATLAAGARRGAVAGVTLEKTGRRLALAATQTHHDMEGRDLVREATLAAFLADPRAGNPAPPALPSLWEERPAGKHTWGLAIDLASCTGCSACVVACQAENNVPVVGRDEVRRGREMHWIRIDRYYSGPPEAPQTVFQPVMCQHCANAPCETVCPVLATVRSEDGLNQQVYNRCIGTRYCENNCPYKVRRFNWFAYAQNPRFDFHLNSPLGSMVLNPDVVTRSRGVMEKCSLCVQRIQGGALAAKQGGRPLADGDIRTACQQACPAQAIVFGDLADPESQVSRLARGPRQYHLLGGLGTRPGVGYLTKIRRTHA